MGELVKELSDGLAEVVKAASQDVVRVEGRRRLPASGFLFERGQVITAHHVLSRSSDIKVGMADGSQSPAKLMGRDPTTDIALLQIEAQAPPSVGWSESADLAVGHLVLALGRPGETVQATLGIVSALGEAWRTPAGGSVGRFLQTDVVMYPGFSGGPLVSASGAIVGMNTSALVRGLSMALPVETLRSIAADLAEHGSTRRAFLGVATQPVRLGADQAGQAGQETALLVVSLEDAGPAESGGVMVGDILLALNGALLTNIDDLLAALSGELIGAKTELVILRGGDKTTLAVQPVERSDG